MNEEPKKHSWFVNLLNIGVPYVNVINLSLIITFAFTINTNLDEIKTLNGTIRNHLGVIEKLEGELISKSDLIQKLGEQLNNTAKQLEEAYTNSLQSNIVVSVSPKGKLLVHNIGKAPVEVHKCSVDKENCHFWITRKNGMYDVDS